MHNFPVQRQFRYKLVVGTWALAGTIALAGGKQLSGQDHGASTPTGSPPATSPQDPRPAKSIEEILAETVRRRKLPGGMVAVGIRHGKVGPVAVTGLRKTGSPEKLQADDRMHVGSCTKAMTATMLATLVEEGKMRWDSTLAELFPDLTIHPGFQLVTLTQLLSHRGGLPGNPANHLELMMKQPENDTQTRAEITASALKQPPEYEPGSRFAYSNLGYIIAGHAAERLTGVSWQALMKQRLFTPLGMNSAGFGPPAAADEVDQPWGHRQFPLWGWQAVPADNPSSYGPAGTVHLSLEDWARFAQFHLRCHPDAQDLLQDETLDRLQQPLADNYALGWTVRTFPDRPAAIGHSGSNTFWFATIYLERATRTGWLIATNCGDVEATTEVLQAWQKLEASAPEPLPNDGP